jgi:hypothetical protein
MINSTVLEGRLHELELALIETEKQKNEIIGALKECRYIMNNLSETKVSPSA